MSWDPQVEKRVHPFGEAGVRSSLEEVCKRAAAGASEVLGNPKHLARVRTWSIDRLHKAKQRGEKVDRPGDRARVLLKAVQDEKLWVPDPIGIEYIPAAHLMACDGDKHDDGTPCVKGDDCFAQGTLVLRDDYTLLPVEQLQAGMRIWGLDRWSVVENAWYKGVLPVSVVRLNNGGELKLTEDHHVYVLDCQKHPMLDNEGRVLPPDRFWRGGMKPTAKKILWGCSCREEARVEKRTTVSELRQGMVLSQPKRIHFGQQETDPDVAYVEGLYLSDGWADGFGDDVKKNYRFHISGQDGCPKEEQKREVQSICARLGIETRWARKYITVKNRDWTLRLHQMGHYAPEKRALSLNLGEGAASGLLRGIMADAGKNTHGNEHTFTTTSFTLFVQTRVLHRMFGISCGSWYIEDHGGLGRNPIWRLSTRSRGSEGHTPWLLKVREVHRNVLNVPCWDITTDDHRVYLPEHDVTVSQCDGKIVFLAACFMSVGLYTMIVGHSYSRDKNIGHVLCKVYFDRKWHYADPSPLGNGKYMDLGECAPPTRERYYSMPTVKVVCDGTTCDRQTLDPHELGFVEEGHFVGLNGITVYELPPEAPGPRVEWLGELPVVEWLGESERVTPLLGWLGEGKTDAMTQAATECGKLYSTDLDTKAGREQSFKSTAKCAADAACTIYSGGAVPPGVCGTVAGPIAEGAVKIWNSVFGDNEEAEKARQRDINTAKFVSMHDQMMTSDASWNAYYRGTMVRLIEFHDQVLPSRRGAWGGGVLTKDKTYWTDYSGKHHEYERQWYSNMCPVLQKLSVAGAPATFHKLSQCPGQIAAPALEDVYRDWSDKNPGVGAVAKSNKLYEIVNSTLPKWTAQLDKAAATLRNEAVIAAVHEKLGGGSAPKKTGAGTKVLIGVSVAAAAAYAASELGWLAFLRRSA